MHKIALIALMVFLVPVTAWAGSGKPQGSVMKCRMPKPAAIRITPVTEEIVYDYSRNSAQIDSVARQVMGATASQRPRGQDTTTGGLRVDTPEIGSKIGWGYETETINGKPTRVCLWFTEVEVEIRLSPVIYVSNVHKPGTVCHDEILAHERRHVQVDREVMNKFAADVGRDIQQVVEKTGAWGPFPASQKDALGKQLIERINIVLNAHEAAMQATMNQRQSQIDSPAEYRRISTVCHPDRARAR